MEPDSSRADFAFETDDRGQIYTPDVFDEDEDEGDSAPKCNILLFAYRALFPDNQPLFWIVIHLALILTYVLFRKVDGRNAIPLCIILVANFAIHTATMLVRLVLVKGIIDFICVRFARVFALVNMLDPCLFYVIWASAQSFLWQILIKRSPGDPHTLIIDVNVPEYAYMLRFNEDDLNWVACSIYIYVILSLRCALLSVVLFLFELNLLKSSNKELKRYLKVYAKMRRFNIDWLYYVLSNSQLLEKLKSSAKNRRASLELFTFFRLSKIYARPRETSLRLLMNNRLEGRDARDRACKAEMPKELWDSTIEASSSSGFGNWLLIYYVTNTAPTITLLHQDVVLHDTEQLDAIVELFFNQIYSTTSVPNIPQRVSIQALAGSANAGATQRGVAAGARSRVSSGIPLHTASNISNPGTNFGAPRASLACPPDRRARRRSREEAHFTLQNFRNVLVTKFGRLFEPDVVNPSPVVADFQFKPAEADAYLDKERLGRFVREDKLDETMQWLDLSGHNRVNLTMFKQAIGNVMRMRKKFKHNIKGQESIFTVLKRLLGVGSWLLALVFVALTAGITAEAIVVSGAALLSAFTVALSYLYTNFITSVIFVAFSNPYNVGDRIRVSGGEPLIVKKIHTYTTEFTSMTGKIKIYQNANLATMHITNESRSITATLEIIFRVDFDTSLSALQQLETELVANINSRPNDFCKNSVWFVFYEVKPGYCYDVAVWASCVESWANWQRVFQLKTEVIELIIKLCKKIGISYKMPVQPVQFTQALTTTSAAKK